VASITERVSRWVLARALGDTPNNIVPPRSVTHAGSMVVSNDSAKKASAVWASIRLRADLVSTMPLNIKRKMPDGSVQIVDTPSLQITGIGGSIDFEEWLYASQADLDLTGNAFGIIKARDPISQRATLIELVEASKVTMSSSGGNLVYRMGGETYQPADVWHERQFAQSGIPVGLSPLRYASMTIGQNMSALQFGLDYFTTQGLPSVQVKNVKKTLKPEESEVIKRRYKSAVEHRDVFVTGNDWEIDIQSIKADESQFLNTLNATSNDIARFFGVPGDIIGLANAGSSVTYANITQRFLELLVLHLQPALVRRERKFSNALLPNKVFAKFDTKALLRLDPTSETAMQATKIASRAYAPDEIRAMNEDPPLTAEQLQQIQDLIVVGAPMAPPTVPKLPGKPEA
jgi:HK97 family phage portal protein